MTFAGMESGAGAGAGAKAELYCAYWKLLQEGGPWSIFGPTII